MVKMNATSIGRILFGTIITAIFASPAWAQAGLGSKTIGFQIENLEDISRLIEVTAGRSLIIRTDEPIARQIVPEDAFMTVLTISPKEILISGRAPGSSQLILESEDGKALVFDVVVSLDLKQLEQALEKALPKADIGVSAIGETVLLTGNVPDSDMAETALGIAAMLTANIRNEMSVAAVQQVMLRVTIAEAARTAIRQLGINAFAVAEDVFLANQIGGINPVEISPIPGPVGLPLNMGFNQGAAGANNTFFFGLPRAQLEVFFLALRENDLLRILAEPTLIALSGQEASFLAGGEIPVPIPQDNNTLTFQYEEFGVQLLFRPTVMGNQKIRLDVAPEVSQLDFARGVTFAGFQIPAFSTRRTQTVVEMASGQTMALAGLLSEEIRGASAKLPGLGEIPILGTLFRSVNYQKQETELLILVTPELIEPLSPDQIAPLPGRGMLEPTDYELYLLGQLEGTEPDSPGPAASSSTAVEQEEPPTSAADSAESSSDEADPSETTIEGPWGVSSHEEAEETEKTDESDATE
jgi:pilus assembly protein CpaC